MARISGIDLPNKRVVIALTYIFGIGRNTSEKILKTTGVDESIRANDLNEDQLGLIRTEIEKYTVEGELRGRVAMNLKRLMDIACYRGLRHRRGLPVRGQKTKTNAQTRKRRRGNIK